MKIKLVLCSAAMLANFVGVAQAASFQNTFGLVAPVSVQDFNSPVVADYSPAGSVFSGMTFSSNVNVTNAYNGSFGSTGQAIVNFYPCCSTPSFVSFSSVINNIGFLFVTNPGTSTFSAYMGNTLVESFSAPSNLSSLNRYYGFTGIAFNKIRFDSGGVNNAMLLDNMQFGPSAVPEPETYAMLLAGLGLLGFARRRKQHC